MEVLANLFCTSSSFYIVLDLLLHAANISPNGQSPYHCLADFESDEEADAWVEKLSLFTTYTLPNGDLSLSSSLSLISSIMGCLFK